MQEHRDFSSGDTNDIEISDLTHAEDTPSKPRYVSLGPRYSFQQRRKQVVITTSIVLLALVMIVGSSFQIRDFIVTKILHTSTNTATSTADLLTKANYFYFQTLPSWGTFLFDGKPLQRPPTLDAELPVKLPSGEHLLEWRAKPFLALSCTLLVPPDPAKQTCSVRLSGSNEHAQNAVLISFPQSLSLNQLPASQRDALTETTQNLLDTLQSSTIVKPGEYYTYNWSTQSYHAGQELNAQIRFLLDTDTTKPAQCNGLRFGPACSFAGNDCRNFCTLTWPQTSSDAATSGWHVAAIIRPTWTYTIASKQTIAHAQSTTIIGDQHFVMLHITWQSGRWQVAFHAPGTSSFDDPNCISTIGSIMEKPMYNFIKQTQQRVTWTFSSGSNRSSGCLATATLHDGDDLRASPTQAPNAYVLQRFGVLMAVNDVAHRLWPALPVVDGYARNVAGDITRNAVFIS